MLKRRICRFRDSCWKSSIATIKSERHHMYGTFYIWRNFMNFQSDGLKQSMDKSLFFGCLAVHNPIVPSSLACCCHSRRLWAWYCENEPKLKSSPLWYRGVTCKRVNYSVQCDAEQCMATDNNAMERGSTMTHIGKYEQRIYGGASAQSLLLWIAPWLHSARCRESKKKCPKGIYVKHRIERHNMLKIRKYMCPRH